MGQFSEVLLTTDKVHTVTLCWYCGNYNGTHGPCTKDKNNDNS